MNYLGSIGVLCLLMLVFPLAALAQIEKPDSGPGFEPDSKRDSCISIKLRPVP